MSTTGIELPNAPFTIELPSALFTDAELETFKAARACADKVHKQRQDMIACLPDGSSLENEPWPPSGSGFDLFIRMLAVFERVAGKP